MPESARWTRQSRSAGRVQVRGTGDGRLDFARRALTANVRWESGKYQNNDSIAGLIDIVLLDQDSKSIADTQARSFYTPPGYQGWKHHKGNQYLIHSTERESLEEDNRKLNFFRDSTHYRHFMFVHHDGRYTR